MSFFPIFARELRAEMQSRRLHKGRFVSGLITGLGLATLILLDRWAGGFNVARFLTAVPIVEMVPFILLVIGLNRAGTLLSVERREGTLPLLLLTRLSGNDIVLAGWTQEWWWSAIPVTALYVAVLVALALRTRRLFLDNLRQVNASRYSEDVAIHSHRFGP